NVARLARLKTNGSSRRNVEPHTARLLAVELQRRICFEEMIVRADLNRPVAGVCDRQRDSLAALVEFNITLLDEEISRDHWITASAQNPVGASTSSRCSDRKLNNRTIISSIRSLNGPPSSQRWSRDSCDILLTARQRFTSSSH